MTAPIELTVERRFAERSDRVFGAWLDPAVAARFLFATPDGTMEKVSLDARVGGGFEIVERRPAGLAVHIGRYEEIDPPYRLVFLFRATLDGEGGSEDQWTPVTIEIVPDGGGDWGGCLLFLNHEMDLGWGSHAERTEQGWTMILARLAEVLEEDE